MWTYSLIWTNRNVAPSRNVVSMPACRPRRLPCLCACSAQCSVNEDEIRIAVLTPAMSFGSSVALGRPLGALHDPDEEVGREEGPEDHDLGDDEKQHPEHRRVHARGAVGRRRAVVLVLVGRARARRPGSRPPPSRPPPAPEDSMCSTGLPVALATRSTSLSATHFERALRQRRDDDLGDVEVLDGVHHRRVRVRVADHAGGHDPRVLERGEQLLEPLARLARPRGRRRGPAGRRR